ncbi:MAG: RHS repeat-associated core domain-containing protein, partial [Bacilli bacterium]
THIIDINGEEKVRYIYDAYGNIIDIDAISPYSEIAEANPYRYRGYRYDSEINMYYLNSRYYNPEIGRFINADGLLGELGNIQSTNMYAYCANNPVMYLDPSGEFPILITLIVVGALIGGGSQYVANVMNGKEGKDCWEGVIGATVGGVIALPAFLYTGPTVFFLAATSGVINGTINEIERSIKYGDNFSLGSAAYDATIYSVLNMIPFVKGPVGAAVEVFVIDVAGFYFADKYKDDFFNGFSGFNNDVSSESRKSILQIYEEFIRWVTGGRGSIYPQIP